MSFKTLQEQIQRFRSEDLYAWKEVDENSASNQIDKLMEDVKQKGKVRVCEAIDINWYVRCM